MYPTEPLVGTMTFVVTQKQQRLVTMGLVGVAGFALVVGALFQGERLPEDPTEININEAAVNGGVESSETDTPTAINPIEGFLPQSGEASACREPVGVDLISGYAATLTINGVEIPPEQMNVNLDDSGTISREITASRSLSQYTFGPEENCPNGSILRATNNVMQACVYRLEDGPDSCVVSEVTFDVL